MGLLVRLLLGFAPWLLVAAAPGAAQGTVEGNLQLGDETVPISHVYARQARPSAASSEPGPVIVMLTDRAPPPEVRASRRAFSAAVREGRLRGALLLLEPEPRFVLLAPGDIQVDTRLPDVFERLTLSDLRQENGTVSGRLQMTEPDELPVGDDGETFTYRVDARFSVPVEPAPRPTATLTGEAARSSPEAEAALRLLQVVHSGSLAEVQAALHPGHSSLRQLSGEEAQFALAVAREFMPAPATFRQSIEQIRIYGDHAVLAARDGDVTTTIAIRRDGETWKLAEVPAAND